MSEVAALLASLREQIDAVLAELIEPGSAVAHVGYPNHWNTGDPAIWLGEQAALQRLGCTEVYQCAWQQYDRAVLAEQIGDGPILISGGGNLGDLWLNHQIFRERVIQDFPGNPIIQLPQSVHFSDPARRARFREICAGHSRLTLLLRDRLSLADAENSFPARCLLAPDMAFSLGALQPPDPPNTGVVPIFWLRRSDKESSAAASPDPGPDCERRDWLEHHDSDLRYVREAEVIQAEIGRLSSGAGPGGDPETTRVALAAAHDRLAWVRVQRGLAMLARGRVVISDRLHAHILGLCLGIPQVLLDNSYRKVSSLHATWTRSSPISHPAADPDEALRIARELVCSRQPS